MPRIIKVVVAVVAVVLLLFSACIAENAVLSVKPKRYKDLTKFYIYANISKNTIKCRANAENHIKENWIVVEIVLESRKKNDEKWSNLDSWTDSGKIFLFLKHDKSVKHGYEYRLKGICKIKDKNGKCLETIVKYSKIVSS